MRWSRCTPRRPEEAGDVAAEAMVAAARTGGQRAAPVLVSWSGQATAGRQRQTMAQAGLAVFPTPEAAVRGALHLARDRRNRAAAAELPSREVLDLAPDRASVRRILEGVRAAYRPGADRGGGARRAGRLWRADRAGPPRRGPAGGRRCRRHAGLPRGAEDPQPRPAAQERGGRRRGRPVLRRRGAGRRRRRCSRGSGRSGRRRGSRASWCSARRRGRWSSALRLGDDAMFGPWIGFGQGGTAADLADDEAMTCRR